MHDDQAAYLVGQAMGHMRQARQLDPQQAAERAGRSVNRAFRLYMKAGLTKEQAIQRIISLAQTFGSLQ